MSMKAEKHLNCPTCRCTEPVESPVLPDEEAYKITPNMDNGDVIYYKPEMTDLFEKIKHGDQAHQDWLKEALECWADGKPVPPPVMTSPVLPEEVIFALGHLRDSDYPGREKLANLIERLTSQHAGAMQYIEGQKLDIEGLQARIDELKQQVIDGHETSNGYNRRLKTALARIDELKAQIEMMNWPNDTLTAKVVAYDKALCSVWEEIYECENNPNFSGHSICSKSELDAEIKKTRRMG